MKTQEINSKARFSKIQSKGVYKEIKIGELGWKLLTKFNIQVAFKTPLTRCTDIMWGKSNQLNERPLIGKETFKVARRLSEATEWAMLSAPSHVGMS